MAKIMLDLNDYVVTDTGEVVVKYNHLVLDLLLMGKSIKGLKTFRHSFAEKFVMQYFRGLTSRPLSDIDYHNRVCEPEQEIAVATINEEPETPPIETFDYNLPESYLSLDLDEYLAQRLVEQFPDLPEIYVARLMLERQMMYERNMQNFIRALIYIVDMFKHHNVVYGIGRGSACASLVLYLIGIHMVDPIEYEIPITEFLR